ncbi:hypothetical protein [Marinobacter sp.]|uniref:hypothetical protein n=1 Tax=Marinobacter sp. TaxID=50741 RepID=UPI0019BC7582|nr:hypothetical protein [Marinobacter sp.]MBC7193864.1 hypothetical protein [Marinobacter sp.]
MRKRVVSAIVGFLIFVGLITAIALIFRGQIETASMNLEKRTQLAQQEQKTRQDKLQAQTNKLMEAIELSCKGTQREGIVTRIEYDGSTVTAYTEIFPDREGIDIIKKFRVSLYTILHSYDPNIKVDSVRVVDKGGNKWVYP